MANTLEKIIAEQSVLVDINAVKAYPKNPRVGDIEAIRESLRENGQFRPLVVQRSTSYILGGNHTWKAAQAEGWSNVSVTYVDVDDEAAKRIVLADNRTNDLASYNADLLAEILSSLPSPVGTGYDDEAFDALLKGVQTRNSELVEDILRPQPALPQLSDLDPGEIGPEGDNSLGGSADLGGLDGPVLENDDDQFKSAPDQVQGAFGLKTSANYEMVGAWHIPPLRPDMLVQPDDVPRGLKAWAGSATKDWPDPDQWWLYNYGIDSTSGMNDISKMIVSFYCWDTYFESWWDYPDRYTAKMLNSGVKMAVTPDFSQWSDEPRTISLFNLYRNRWLGRYFQEAGIKIIPNISWRYDDKDYYDNVVRATLPKKLPVIAIQLQTYDQDQTPQQLDDLRAFIEYVGETCDPELTIFYVGKQGDELLKTMKWPGEMLVVPNRLKALGEQAKGRQKKTTF